MIRARLASGVFVLGIDAENVQRLKDGKPLFVDLSGLGGRDSFVMVYGDTLADVRADLEKVFGAMPPAQPTGEGHA